MINRAAESAAIPFRLVTVAGLPVARDTHEECIMEKTFRMVPATFRAALSVGSWLEARAAFARSAWIFAVALLSLLAACEQPGDGAVETSGLAQALTPPTSERTVIDLSAGMPGQSHWRYLKGQDSTTYASTAFDDSSWAQVGIPHGANYFTTFLNTVSGGGDGYLDGGTQWYRLKFTMGSQYANSKVVVEFEGAHTGAQVYINGTLLPGISAVAGDAQASHVIGFLPFIVDLTPYLKTDGTTQNVLAVRVARGASWFTSPHFSGAFRFGQAEAGLFRPAKMFITKQGAHPRQRLLEPADLGHPRGHGVGHPVGGQHRAGRLGRRPGADQRPQRDDDTAAGHPDHPDRGGQRERGRDRATRDAVGRGDDDTDRLPLDRDADVRSADHGPEPDAVVPEQQRLREALPVQGLPRRERQRRRGRLDPDHARHPDHHLGQGPALLQRAPDVPVGRLGAVRLPGAGLVGPR
jgi:hypothetical protein